MEKKAKRGDEDHEIHVIVFPYPIQGHINPMLQFSKQLASRGLRVTLATTSSLATKFTPLDSNSINIETISDGSTETANTENVEAHIKRFNDFVPESLTRLIEKKLQLKHHVKCLVYDSAVPWGLEIARKFGIYGTPFFTQSCLANLIFYQVYNGVLSAPIEEETSIISCVDGNCGVPLIMEAKDVPSFVHKIGLFPILERLLLDQFTNCSDADWCFFNSIDGLETEVVNWMASKMPVKTIGPAIPSMYVDKRFSDDKDYGLSLFQPQTGVCIPWLDAKENGTVVYASMGSLASLGEEQMEEMAIGLERSNKYFLWVVRASEENKLPPNFKERTSERGLIVNWCPQLEVLAHPALGCFVTHCGWNSTLEAVSLGVPMVAFPIWTDQPTNAKCIADIWKVGVRVKANEKGVVTREEMEICIRQVMEGERGKEIKSNAIKWKQVAKMALEEGGSSDRNIEEFVAKLLAS